MMGRDGGMVVSLVDMGSLLKRQGDGIEALMNDWEETVAGK